MQQGAREQIETVEGLRDVVGVPSDLVVDKTLDHLDPHARAFIALSPMVMVATADAEGRCDASPRGDPPGFVQALDDTTLLIPDRKGNRRVDTMANLTSNPHIGLLFLIPGTNETVRVNGTATITTDTDLLEACTVNGKVPALGILVSVEEVFVHCARAFLRGGVWRPESWPDRSELPTLGRMLRDQLNLSASVEQIDSALDAANRDLY